MDKLGEGVDCLCEFEFDGPAKLTINTTSKVVLRFSKKRGAVTKCASGLQACAKIVSCPVGALN